MTQQFHDACAMYIIARRWSDLNRIPRSKRTEATDEAESMLLHAADYLSRRAAGLSADLDEAAWKYSREAL